MSFLLITPAFAHTTDASKYLKDKYEELYNKQVKIVVTKEHTEEYQQKIGEVFIPAITYGYGTMKVKGQKKSRVAYICLLDNDLKPIWGHVIPR